MPDSQVSSVHDQADARAMYLRIKVENQERHVESVPFGGMHFKCCAVKTRFLLCLLYTRYLPCPLMAAQHY